MLNRIVLLVSLFAAMVLATTDANAERRVALVVGNSDYSQVAMLNNPRNDAIDLAAALKKLGFEVLLGIDLDQERFAGTIDKFARLLDGADVGLFFYAGHGLQLDEKNYLVSIDAKLNSEFFVSAETVELDSIVRLMESKVPVNLVFLDACRNNPLAENLKRNVASLKRGTALGRGLARIEPSGHDTLVAFAAAPGQEAVDGTDRNSPFTAALLKYLPQSGLEVSVMLKQVAADVRLATRNEQRPQQVSDMSRTFYFANAEPKPEAAAVAKVDAAQSRNGDAANRDLDIAFWSSAQSQGDCDAIRAYLQRFPQGNFVELARLSERRLCTSPPLAPKPEAGPATQASAPAVAAPPPVVVLPPQSVAQQVVAALPSSGKSDAAAEPPATVPVKPTPLNVAVSAKDASKDAKDPDHSASDPSTGPNSTLTVTALTPPHDAEPSTAAPEPAASGPDLARNIQVELARVGCGDILADGKWRSATRQAVRRFNAEAKTSFDVHEPSQALIAALRAHDQRVCPVQCERGFDARGGACVANDAPAPRRRRRPAGGTWAERRTANQWSTLRWQGFDPNRGWNRGRPNRPCRINPGFGYGQC